MKTLLTIFTLLFTLMFSSTSFAGGYAQVLKVSYEPILQSKQGRIEGCGVHFTAVIQQEKRVFAVLGSLNQYYFKGKIPSLNVKILPQEYKNGKFILSKLSSAYIRGQNFTTIDFFFNQFSEETSAWLAMTTMEKNPELFATFINSLVDRPWIGFNLGNGNNDFSFQLPQPKEATLFEDVHKCSLQALDQFQRELPK
jgi:hypothetical protein